MIKAPLIFWGYGHTVRYHRVVRGETGTKRGRQAGCGRGKEHHCHCDQKTETNGIGLTQGHPDNRPATFFGVGCLPS
jgi:hypothetical protein